MLKTLLEMPESINDNALDHFSLPDVNKELTQKFLRQYKKEVIKYVMDPSVNLYEGKRDYALIDTRESTPKTLYYMEYKIFDNVLPHGQRCVSQVKVWRDFDAPETEYIAKEIFFEHLLYKYKTVMTDKRQTRAGQLFWRRRISQSFDSNLYHYYFNTNTKELLEIKDLTHWNQLRPKLNIWGKGKEYQHKMLIISEVPISP